VKPAAFEYHVARDLPHAVELLDGEAVGGKVLAGGQSLVPLLNLRRITPPALVDVSRCGDGNDVREDGDRLAIGALVTYRELEESELVAAGCGLLQEALRYVGSPGVRNRGTVGGSLAHADPTAELPAVVAALGGELTVIGPGARRQVPFEEFCAGPFQVALAPVEVVTEVRLQKLPEGAGWGFVEVSRRYAGSAQMAAAAAIHVEGGRVRSAWISVAGLAGVPTKARTAEEGLRGEAPTAEAFEAAALTVVEEVAALDEAPYRRQLARVLVGRALQQSLRRARDS
jgi:CO/xanthine dehydrogenase FAD-binding subunit